MDNLIAKSFIWMFVGLIVTFLTGYIVSMNSNMVELVLNSSLYLVLLVLELVLVIFFVGRLAKMSETGARICFLLYAFVSGLTFSSIFVYFELASVMFIFLAAGLAFLIFGVIGLLTKIDLSKIRNVLLMGLIAILIMTLINVFVGNSTFDLIVSIIGLVIFFGFTAYDVQRIKYLSNNGFNGGNVAIYGAFQLYLDFINIFVHLISLLGKSKD